METRILVSTGNTYNPEPMDFETILDNIANKQPFHFVRYGDGELGIMYNDPKIMGIVVKRHGDREGLEKAGRIMLADLDKMRLTTPKDYYLGIQPMGYKMFPEQTDRAFKDLPTCSAQALHKASEQGRLKEFTDLLKGRRVIVVGRDYLSKLPFEHIHIKTFDNLVWRQTDYINTVLKQNLKAKDIVLWCASLATNICMFENYRPDVTQIDCGSVFDPYCFGATRKYHHKLKDTKL